MRTTPILIALLLTASAAAAQQDGVPTRPTGSSGSIDFGMRFTELSGDQARTQRFRDVRDGGVADRFRFEQRGTSWLLDGGADHVGRLDQRFFATLRAGGKVKASFRWDQIPLFISADTRTLYRAESPGVLRLDDGLQADIQAGTARLTDFVGGAGPLDLRSHRYIAALDFLYTPAPSVNVNLNVKQTRREGTMPYGASLGFNNAIEVAAPIDTLTTDLATGVEWTGRRGMVRMGYDGSWFDNKVQTLVWDNPLKLTDATAPAFSGSGLGASQGRAALPPSSTMQGVSTAGALKLPGATRLSGTVSVGAWRQNEALLPATINSAIPAITLPRDTAQAEARTLAMNYTATSQPVPYVWLNARYRYYDFDNRTPEFVLPQFVILDQTVQVGVKRGILGASTQPVTRGRFGSTRQNVDLDISLTPVPLTAFRVGYSRELADRGFRIFGRTTEETYRSSIDLNAGSSVVVRGIVERAHRSGSRFNGELLEEVREQSAMRHFDIADRDRDRATGLLQISASRFVGLSASAAMGTDDYKNSGFGLRNNKNRVYTLGADLSAGSKIGGNLSYILERYSALQNSRTASSAIPSTVTDPTRDWAIDSSDRSETWTAQIDAMQLVPRTELHLGYDLTHSNAAYVYRVPGDSTVAPLVQLPSVRNERRTATADVVFTLTRRVGIGLSYWHEKYFVDDFSFNQSTITSLALPGSLYLGYVFRPYTVDSATARLILTW